MTLLGWQCFVVVSRRYPRYLAPLSAEPFPHAACLRGLLSSLVNTLRI